MNPNYDLTCIRLLFTDFCVAVLIYINRLNPTKPPKMPDFYSKPRLKINSLKYKKDKLFELK
ncbi:hypothetical protein BpHYR1_048373 [Brachionus plicatilis]|uniref:Uncharacterized protein n=1 Tax=Brachionus plicatilis TaxID=10195 RepID=A0A3M7QFZ7_BRAPC|nr:hypothetical protein BpHYR1_048373 [Brachionus plicatilis]